MVAGIADLQTLRPLRGRSADFDSTREESMFCVENVCRSNAVSRSDCGEDASLVFCRGRHLCYGGIRFGGAMIQKEEQHQLLGSVDACIGGVSNKQAEQLPVAV